MAVNLTAYIIHAWSSMPSVRLSVCMLQSIRSGNYPVMDKDHILVLNWNRQTIPLLRQLALTRTEQQGSAQKHSVARKHKIQKSKGMFLADK